MSFARHMAERPCSSYIGNVCTGFGGEAVCMTCGWDQLNHPPDEQMVEFVSKLMGAPAAEGEQTHVFTVEISGFGHRDQVWKESALNLFRALASRFDLKRVVVVDQVRGVLQYDRLADDGHHPAHEQVLTAGSEEL